jgi:hypothetical protein
MKEGFFLDRIQLKPADVPMRHEQPAPAVEPNSADSVEAVRDEAPVSACHASNASVVEVLVKVAFRREGLEKIL